MTSKLLILALAGCLIVPSLHAQRSHGIGASITSVSPHRGSFNNPGIPPSVTSITPGMRANRGFFSTNPNPNRGRRHGREFGRRFGRGNNFVPFFVPYGYGYDYTDSYPDASAPDQPDYGQQQQEDPQPPALTIFENRPGYRPPPVQPSDAPDQSGASAADRSREPAPPVADQTPTVLVFRDGRKLEIGNYAIQGDLLYNLGNAGPRKIKLADLDLDKTIQANDERGNEFRLPRKFRG
jgi:hypothetical protein